MNTNLAVKQLVVSRRIAVVGLSDDPSRTSFHVASYLLSAGKEIVPVNPNCKSVFGQQSYARLEDVPGHIDLVNVFRRPEYCADIARSAVAVGTGGLWLQSGIVSEEAQQIAAAAKMPFVQDRCLMVELSRAE